MPVVFQYRLFSTPTALLKTLVLSSAVVATVVLSGCASKPQVNNSA
ncbi:peptidoglycan-binding protein, partial [Acinetobacter sp. 207]